tara:strand:- start:16996 stop:17799 length:804 start_codon:yes stop_codon:yes gene_type:complete
MSIAQGKNAENMKAVAKKATGQVATFDAEQFADQGFEKLGQKDLALPFLKILGGLSPQVTQGDAKFIEQARPGMIYNSVTDQLYNGEKGIKVVPCFYKLEYVEWQDRDKASGAPANIYGSDSDIMSKTTRDDQNKDRLENGNYVEETASHFILIVENNEPKETALITMKSTQRKKSKKWNSMMVSIREPRKNGKGFYKPAPFTQIYTLKSVLEKNKLGSWYGWDIEYDGLVPNQAILDSAHSFHQSCSGGIVNVKHDNEEQAPKTAW